MTRRSVLALAVALLAGCGGSAGSTDSTRPGQEQPQDGGAMDGGQAGADASADACAVPGRPNTSGGDETVTVFAIRTLDFGEPDGTDNESPPYLDIGRNVVGGAAASCMAMTWSVPKVGVYVNREGRCGARNAFGAYAAGLSPATLSATSSDQAGLGHSPTLLQLSQLPTGADSAHVEAALLRAAAWANPPTFSPGEPWSPTTDSLGPSGPTWSFGDGFLANNSVVAGQTSYFELTAHMAAPGVVIPVTLRVHNASFSGTLAADHRSVDGVLSGILSTTELDTELYHQQGAVSVSLCDQLHAPQTNQYADVPLAVNDPSMPCDGISFGVRFSAVAVTLGAVVPPAPPVAPPCP